MADVTISVHGKSYTINCDAGQERRVRDLGHFMDQRITDVAKTGGVIAENQLLVLAGLMMADEIFELHEALTEAQKHSKSGPVQVGLTEREQKLVAENILKLASKIEDLTQQMQKAAA